MYVFIRVTRLAGYRAPLPAAPGPVPAAPEPPVLDGDIPVYEEHYEL